MRCKASGKVSNGNTGHRRAQAKALCSIRHAGVTLRFVMRQKCWDGTVLKQWKEGWAFVSEGSSTRLYR